MPPDRYEGRVVEVRVLPHGLEFEGDFYRPLSAAQGS